MAITINWGTKVISVLKEDMDYQVGPPEVYELNVDTFRLALKSLEDSEDGMAFPDTHSHNTEASVAGITLARVVQIINGYTVTFEDDQYVVSLVGANNNILDVTNQNQVSVRSANSAGLITVSQGSGVTEQDKTDIADRVLDEVLSEHATPGTLGKVVNDTRIEAQTTMSIVSGVETSISEVGIDIEDIQSIVSGVESTLGDIGGDISSIEGSISDVEGNMLSMQTSMDNVEVAVSGVEISVENMEAAVSDMTGDVGGIQADTTELLARITLARAVSIDTLVANTTLLRKISTNRLELKREDGVNLILYDDDGTTPIFKWVTTDINDGLVEPEEGIPAKRIPVE